MPCLRGWNGAATGVCQSWRTLVRSSGRQQSQAAGGTESRTSTPAPLADSTWSFTRQLGRVPRVSPQVVASGARGRRIRAGFDPSRTGVFGLWLRTQQGEGVLERMGAPSEFVYVTSKKGHQTLYAPYFQRTNAQRLESIPSRAPRHVSLDGTHSISAVCGQDVRRRLMS